MANRTYLYATDLIPMHSNAGAKRKIIGLSECKYELPFTFRLLIAGDPQLCLSNIWHFRTEAGALPHPLALASSFAAGLDRARTFHALLVHPVARECFGEVLAFLDRPENQQTHLLLELGEYLSMFEDDDEPKGKLHEKAAAFRAMLEGDPSDSIKEFAEELNALPQGASNETKQLVLERLGNCTWSNVLYHEPGETGA